MGRATPKSQKILNREDNNGDGLQRVEKWLILCFEFWNSLKNRQDNVGNDENDDEKPECPKRSLETKAVKYELLEMRGLQLHGALLVRVWRSGKDVDNHKTQMISMA